MKNMKYFRRKNGGSKIGQVLYLVLTFNMLTAMPLMASIANFAARVDPAGLGTTIKLAATVPAVSASISSPAQRSGGGGGEPTIIWPIEIPDPADPPGWKWEEKTWIPPEEGYLGYWEWGWVWYPGGTILWYPSPEQLREMSTKEPIDTVTGNNYFTEQRLYVPCPGVPLSVDLKYQSVTNRLGGNLGKGWYHSYEWTLDEQTNNVAIHMPTGGRMVFELGTNGLYQSAEDNDWELVATTNGFETSIPEGLAYSFSTNGQLSFIQDAWGNRVECSYGTNDCLEAVEHANGRQLVFSNEWHAASGEWRVATVQMPGGVSLGFDYNVDGQLAQVVEQVGANSYTSSYQYADSFLTNKVNGAGFEYTYEYEEEDGTLNGKGTYLAVDGYYEHEVSYADFSTDVTYHRQGTNQIFRYSRNSGGKLEAIYGPTETIGNIELRGKRYAYATNDMDTIEETLFDDTTGATWSKWMLYDDAHNVTNFAVSYGTTNPVQQLSMEYDPLTQLSTAVVDADNLRLEVVYTNGFPLVEKAFYSDTNSYNTHYAYTTNGLLRAFTNANGHVVDYGYDSMGNMTTVAAEVGLIVTNIHDSLGFVKITEILSESGAHTGRIMQYNRDAKGRVIQVVFADGLTSSNAYNALGYLTNSVDRAGRRIDYTYAPTKKLTSVTRWLKQGGSKVPVRVGYDLDEQVNVLRITEPRGRYVESYKLDIQDRVTSVTNIEAQVMNVDYSIGGFVTQVTRFDGSSIANVYAHTGRKESATFNPGGANPLVINYSYYPDGLPESVFDGTSSITNLFDRLNRLTNVVSSVGDSLLDIRYSHDPVGNVTNTVVSVGGAQVSATAYTYDEVERLSSISTFLYEYNTDNGRVASVSNTVSGITCSFAYDLMDRATNITYLTVSGSLIRSLDYAYDATSMIVQKRISNTEQGTPNSEVNYEYDSINRLVGESTSTNGSSLAYIQYSYDLAGNRLTKTTDGIGVAYALGDGNRLASARTAAIIDMQGSSTEPIGTDDRWGELWVSNLNAQVGWVPEIDGYNFWADDMPLEVGTNQLVAALRDQAGNTDYTTNTVYLSAASTNMQYGYDAAGCMTNLNGVSLEWDERYRLTSAVQDSVFDIQYSYDVLNHRTSRIEGSTTNYFVYNGNQVVADFDGSGNLLRTYTWGMGIDNLLVMTAYGATATNTYYAIKDHQNSVIALVDDAGLVIESYEYNAYGRVLDVKDGSGNSIANQQSAIGNRYTFQGREIDWATGLYYFRARWYDPDTGRWLSKDPIGISGGMNLYVAFGNNPVNFVDPLGLEDITFLGPGDKNYGSGPASGGAGVTIITAHGFPNSIENHSSTAPDIGTTLNGTQAGNALNGMVPSGDVIVLYACNTGCGSFGQDFANATGNTVIAPNGYVSPDGKVYPTEKDGKNGTNQINPSDAWTTFCPE